MVLLTIYSDLELRALLRHIAPIDGHGMPGDKRGRIGAEPHHRFRDFFWLPIRPTGSRAMICAFRLGICSQPCAIIGVLNLRLDRHN